MKKVILKILIISYILIPILNVKALEINSENAVLYNLNDDRIIYEKNSDQKVKIASLTKIMTTIVALEHIDNIKDQMIMPKEAFEGLDGYVVSGIKAKESVTYEDVLYGIMLPSGADCANAIAIDVSGDIKSFVELMNKKAEELNMKDTHFSNPIGMDDENYSTVKDIAILLKYAIKNEEFYKIFTTKEYKTSNNIMLESTLIEKSRPYNIDVSSILGSKTGYTDEAGNCLATITKLNNVNYLLITTNANTESSFHIIDAVNIYEYYSTNYSYKKILSYNQYIKTLNIKEKNNKKYNITSNIDKYMYLENNIDINNLEYDYEGIEEITKDIKENDKIGTLKIKYEDNIIYEEDILLNEKIYFYNTKIIIASIVLILIILIMLKKKRKRRKKRRK